jgi:hypothetical protein
VVAPSLGVRIGRPWVVAEGRAAAARRERDFEEELKTLHA